MQCLFLESDLLFDRLCNYLKLNYIFDLDKTYVLDSAIFGNETRYLNHSEDANCSATGN